MYGTGSVKIWKTRHKIFMGIRKYGYFYSVVEQPATGISYWTKSDGCLHYITIRYDTEYFRKVTLVYSTEPQTENDNENYN